MRTAANNLEFPAGGMGHLRGLRGLAQAHSSKTPQYLTMRGVPSPKGTPARVTLYTLGNIITRAAKTPCFLGFPTPPCRAPPHPRKSRGIHPQTSAAAPFNPRKQT